MMGLTRRERRLSLMLAGSILLLLATPIYQISDRRLPRDIQEIAPQNSPVVPGEDLKLLFKGIFWFNCRADVSEKIIDSDAHVWPIERRRGVLNNFEPANPFSREIDISTVEKASPGVATYSQDVDYRCNDVQRIIWPIHVHREARFVFAATPATGVGHN